MAHDFRFGFSMRDATSATFVREEARRAEQLGYDVLLVPDHLGIAAPFPALTAVASVTERLHVGTFVLNACFYKPALLAREVQTLHDISGGRFEVGLGAGYVKEEFDMAELPFPSAGKRVAYLEHVTSYLAQHVPGAPIVIAGGGDRLLTVAAKWATTVGVTGDLGDRVAFLRAAAGDRFDDIELNVAITAVPTDGSGVPNLKITRRFAPDATDEELLASPGVLSGTVADQADKLRRLRDEHGATYFVVQSAQAEAFGKVIEELR